MNSSLKTITVGARSSALSRAQMQEVLQELCQFYPEIVFDPMWVETSGDKDLKTSLRSLEKTDFFTREIDALQLTGICRISIHSAKDLPDPLPKGLVLAALTKGVDPSDVIVFRGPETLESLPLHAKIGTSSVRREHNIKALRSDLHCVDIRGSIEQRLALLDQKQIDGVVMAEAALIRLKLTHRHRIPLPGERAPLQGQLAVLALEKDQEMQAFLRCIDVRKKTVLYLGTDPSQFECQGRLIHYPVIKIVPRSIEDVEIRQAYDDLEKYTHFIFTSKNAVKVFCEHLSMRGISSTQMHTKTVIAIGQVTAAHLSAHGLPAQFISDEETQEGVVKLLSLLNLNGAYVFMPRSALSRPVLVHFFQERNIRYCACDLYDTVTQCVDPVPDLDQIDEIIFTSPSTVRAFVEIFGKFPVGKKLVAIGPITEESLLDLL